ncbi:hypothetical protein CJF30_00008894 [Rutstroemia sp. NJR-2017a BBW]|nr:hypothetical protein CJF30_00008894 [Rutstroemia sp. NJR-2017a BBW]
MVANGHRGFELDQEDLLTVEDYAKALLNRIESRNTARALDQIPHDQRGRLHGVAIAIKDNMDTKDEILLTRPRHANRIWF